MAKIEIPNWIQPPQFGKLRCTYVGEEGDEIGEHGVQFKVGGRLYTTWVQPEFIDIEQKLMMVCVVASLKDGSYLVDLPSDTLTSGTRLQIHRDAPELVYDPK